MWASRYWNPRYWADRYWGKTGADTAPATPISVVWVNARYVNPKVFATFGDGPRVVALSSGPHVQTTAENDS